jgi:ABC-type amino acid transport substrate-binding protein
LRKHLTTSAVVLVLVLVLVTTVSACGSSSGRTNATIRGEGTAEISAEAKAADAAIAGLAKSAGIQTPNTIQAGVLLAGCDAASPPLEFLANLITGPKESEVKTPKVVGFEADLLTAVAKKLGLEAGFLTTSWTDLPKALAEGGVDIAASAMVTSPELLGQFNATDAYLAADLAICAAASNQLVDGAALNSGQPPNRWSTSSRA